MNAALRCLVLLPLMLVGGCLDYTEEVFVGRDGTGRMRTEVAVLNEFMTEEDAAELRAGLEDAVRQLGQHPDVSKVQVADRREDHKHHFVLDVTTKTYEALPRVMNAEDWLRFDALEGKGLRYVRVLDEGGSAAAYASAGRRLPDVGRADDVAVSLIQKALPRFTQKKLGVTTQQDEDELDFHVTFRLHAPKVVKSNGEAASGVATWRWRLEEFEDSAPGRLEADLDLTGPSFLLPVVAAFSLGCVFLWLRKKWRRRWE